jgi:hypothetical protein
VALHLRDVGLRAVGVGMGLALVLFADLAIVEGVPRMSAVGGVSSAGVTHAVEAWHRAVWCVAVAGMLGAVAVPAVGGGTLLVAMGMDALYLSLLPVLRADGIPGLPWVGLAVYAVAGTILWRVVVRYPGTSVGSSNP